MMFCQFFRNDAMIQTEKTGTDWDTAEINLLGTAADAAIAQRIGRSVKAVEHMRRKLKVPAFHPHTRRWSKRELALLGKLPDAKLAARLGISRRCVLKTRQRLGIAAFAPQFRPKSA
jgi:hypothetical protein